MKTGSVFAPPAGNDVAAAFDSLYRFLLIASVVALIILIGGMIFFAFKYRRKNSDKSNIPTGPTHNLALEVTWSVIPFIIFMVAFIWGALVFWRMRPGSSREALEIYVYGRQWAWDFVYKSGKKVTNEFVVPVKRQIRLIMTSEDVIHSFFIPSLRIKQDAVPGRYTQLVFKADKLGSYHVFCAEYCGAAHSQMLAVMKVVSLPEFEQWLQQSDEGLSLAQLGAKLYQSKGCVACHSIDGALKVGPSWKGLWGRDNHPMDDGQVVKVDEEYLRESILEPNAKVVKGFARGIMPTYQGQLDEKEIQAIIEFIKELK